MKSEGIVCVVRSHGKLMNVFVLYVVMESEGIYIYAVRSNEKRRNLLVLYVVMEIERNFYLCCI